MGSDRSFGIIFSIVFLIISLWPLIAGESIRIWSLFFTIILLIISYARPVLLHTPNKLWFKLGLILGNIIAPIIMGIVFFVVVTPTSLIMKIIGKDLLNNKYDKNKKSYWIIRDKPKSTMKQQF